MRFYEKKCIIAPADRGENGYWDYPAELVDVLRFIERAQELGFSLKENASIEVDAGTTSCRVQTPCRCSRRNWRRSPR
ncbi:MerR family transcriptional regulator [Arenibacterium halophilum]|uniref:MerR family transcriptional regulator n=1 Tax=Arenibacterium halophilum TaxID=2583821 RepID=UPI001FE543FC|nr:MerR family transcriptional regulator [Arenibacterium halophilum]